MKYITALILVLFFSKALAQEAFIDIPNTLKTGKKKTEGVFTLVNHDESKFAVFMDDTNGLNGYLYDATGTEISKYNSEGLPDKYDAIVGYTMDGNVIRLFVKNKNNRTFGSILYDFDNNLSDEKEFDLKLKNERYLQSFSKDGKFYFITIKEKSSTFHIYSFSHDGNFKKKEISLENKTFRNKHNTPTSLYEVMAEKTTPADDFEVVMIYPDLPSTIQTTRSLLKMYPAPEGVVLTIDKSPSMTYYLTFDVNNSTVKFDGFLKPLLTNTSEYSRSNSFVTNGVLFQVIANKKELSFEAKNIATKEKLISERTSKNENVDYKNSPYYGLGSRTIKDDDSSKFLNQLGSNCVGITAALQADGGYQVTLGAFNYDVQQNNSGTSAMTLGAIAGGLVGGLIAAAITSSMNPSTAAFASYSNIFVYRIECLFDENMKSKEGTIKVNVFDRIRLHIPADEDRPIENVFQIDNKYLYGYYDVDNDIFKIKSFSILAN